MNLLVGVGVGGGRGLSSRTVCIDTTKKTGTDTIVQGKDRLLRFGRVVFLHGCGGKKVVKGTGHPCHLQTVGRPRSLGR